MKVIPFALFAGICLLLVVGRPDFRDPTPPGLGEVQEQQERQEQEVEEVAENQYRVTYQVMNIHDEPIADIVWLKRAAEVALASGSPYFHVVNQVATKQFVREQDMQLTQIEGVIQLEADPMNAEYDAYVISELELDELAPSF
jgi:hypothetical protein